MPCVRPLCTLVVESSVACVHVGLILFIACVHLFSKLGTCHLERWISLAGEPMTVSDNVKYQRILD